MPRILHKNKKNQMLNIMSMFPNHLLFEILSRDAQITLFLPGLSCWACLCPEQCQSADSGDIGAQRQDTPGKDDGSEM